VTDALLEEIGGPGADDCDRCLAERCCETRGACRNSSACRAIIDCVVACGRNTRCVHDCQSKNPGGLPFYLASRTCLSMVCSVRCGVGTEAGVLDPCLACIYGHCPDSWIACQTEPRCVLFENCLADCGGATDECLAVCKPEAGAPTVWDDEQLCVAAHCAAECL
jgi:hypothetical protein